tara:strand:+ start:2952 stop:4049 length:1098 start_codon:yes stop_codon:yes gene_type:complete
MNAQELFNTWWKITLLILGLLLIVVLPGFAFPTWYGIGQDDEYIFSGEPPAALNIRASASWAAVNNYPDGDWGTQNYKLKLEKMDENGNDMVNTCSWYTGSAGGAGGNSNTISCVRDGHGLSVGDIVVVSFVSTAGAGASSYQDTESQNGSYKVTGVPTSNTFQIVLTISVSKADNTTNSGSSSFIYWYKSSCNGDQHDQKAPSQCKTGTRNNPLPLGFDPNAVSTSALATANWNSYKGPQPIVYRLMGNWSQTSRFSTHNKKVYFKIVGKDLVFDVQHNNYAPYENEDLPTGFSINYNIENTSLTTQLMETGVGKIYSNAIVKPDDKLYLRFIRTTADSTSSGSITNLSLGYITVPAEFKPVKK